MNIPLFFSLTFINNVLMCVVMVPWLYFGDIFKCYYQRPCSCSLLGQHVPNPSRLWMQLFHRALLQLDGCWGKACPESGWKDQQCLSVCCWNRWALLFCFSTVKLNMCISQFFIESVTWLLIEHTESHPNFHEFMLSKMQAVVNRPSL